MIQANKNQYRQSQLNGFNPGVWKEAANAGL